MFNFIRANLMNSAPQHELVSILVATRNRPAFLRECIRSLLACDYPNFEIIVIDQSPAPFDGVQEPRLQVLHSPTSGKSAALNEGLQIARGAIIAFTDDDCTVSREWVRRGVNVLEKNPDVGLVFGPLNAPPHDPTEIMIPTVSLPSFEVHRGLTCARVRVGAGANMLARKSLFDALKGFDETLGPGAVFKSCEEFDIYYRALANGFAIARTPDNPVLHWGVRSVKDGSDERLIRDYWFGEGAVLGKYSRKQDRYAISLGLKTFGLELNWAARSLVRGRTTNLYRALSWGRGFCLGFASRRQVYRIELPE